MNFIAIGGLPSQGRSVDHCKFGMLSKQCLNDSGNSLKNKTSFIFLTRTIVANFPLVHKRYFIGLSLTIPFKCHPSYTFSDEMVPFQMRYSQHEAFKNL